MSDPTSIPAWREEAPPPRPATSTVLDENSKALPEQPAAEPDTAGADDAQANPDSDTASLKKPRW